MKKIKENISFICFILSIACFIMTFTVNGWFFIAGIVFIFACAISYVIHQEKEKIIAETTEMDFPKTDSKGNELEYIEKITLSGHTQKKNGVSVQSAIENLQRDDEVYLVADPKNKYDKETVMAISSLDDYIGTIPRDCDTKSEIFERLQSGQDVYAKVSLVCESDNYFEGKGDKPKCCKIQVALYKSNNVIDSIK